MEETKEELRKLLTAARSETADRRHRRYMRLAALAADPDVTGDALEQIASSVIGHRSFSASDLNKEQLPLLEALAGNPNASPELLGRLAMAAPRALYRNPSLPLLPLSDPDWAVKIGREARVCLLRSGEAPAFLVTLLRSAAEIAGEQTIREEADLHIACAGEASPGEWLSAVREHWRRHVADAGATLRNAYTQFAIAGILPGWAAESAKEMSELRRHLTRAADPATPLPERVRYYEEHPIWIVRVAALLNPVTPQGIRRQRLAQEYADKNALSSFRQPGLDQGEDFIAVFSRALREEALRRHSADEVPFAAFCIFLERPAEMRNILEAQSQGFRWPHLLGWALGVCPRRDGTWEPKIKAGLRALAGDGNRWVRAAARARLANPDVMFSW